MSLLIRKLFCLFVLNNLILCSLTAQIPIPVRGIVAVLTHEQKPVKVFSNFKFDTADAIIGIGFSDSTNITYDRFSFIIDNEQDLNELKKSWKFKEAETVSDHRAFSLNFVRNKEIKNVSFIFPESNAIVTDKGCFAFDTVLLSKLHAKSPLAYNVHADTVSNKDFLRFKDSVKAKPSFLFLKEPEMLYEGSFDITIKAGSKISPENIGQTIFKRCDNAKPKSVFKVYSKEDGKTYLVRGSQFLFEQFSDPDMEKSVWKPAVYIIKSYWRVN